MEQTIFFREDGKGLMHEQNTIARYLHTIGGGNSEIEVNDKSNQR